MYGRFLSPDPARDQHFEETQSWNIYSYVQNNPTMKIDPTGMFWEELRNKLLVGKWETNAEQNSRYEKIADERNRNNPFNKALVDANMALNNKKSKPTSNHSSSGGNIFIADGAKLDKAVIDGQMVGKGECYSLIQATSSLPNHKEITRGEKVLGNTSIPENTVIGTFDKNGNYTNKSGTAHVAAYRGQSGGSVTVVDQWNGKTGGEQPPHIHSIKTGGKTPNRDASQYYVVTKRRNQ